MLKLCSMVVFAALEGAAFAEGNVSNRIAIPEKPTAVERTAAKELAEALARITGEKYGIVSEKGAAGAAYAVGATKLAAKLATSQNWGATKPDEIRHGTVGGCVVLTGDATRGALYSVDSFLEDVAGVRWWTTGESDYPNRPGWRPGNLPAYRYAPPFRMRETFYRATLTDAEFKVRQKVNTTSYTRYIIPPAEEQFIPEEKGGNHKLIFYRGRRSAYHSFFEVLPPKKYAAAHPDWYSEINGKRVGGGQLCVTNPEMLKEYVKNTLELLRANPDCDTVSVSQNDEGEQGVCRCAKCLAAKEQEGSWSGPYLTFANKVAEAVEKEFPNVCIDTFAYMFTRKAPKTVRPRKNVLVRLCDIECAFNRPLADPTYAQNRTFAQDLKDWSRVAAGNLYLWDYQANFTSYMMPHPNLPVFAENLRLFRDAGAVGVFEQGDAMCPAGDFCALKCWVTAHLVWDPSKDWKALTDEFLNGYYGKAAAPHLKKALEIAAASASRPGVAAMGCYHSEPYPWITPEAGRAALAEMAAASGADERAGGLHRERIMKARLAWDHAKFRAWERWGFTESPWRESEEFRKKLDYFKIDAYRETTTRQTLINYLNGPFVLFACGCDWVKQFKVDGRNVRADDRHQIDFAKVYPGETRKGEEGKRFAEATAAVYGGADGGARVLLVYADWFAELTVNGGQVQKFDGPCDCQDARVVNVILKPGRNEVKIRVRAGTSGRWYAAVGMLRKP